MLTPLQDMLTPLPYATIALLICLLIALWRLLYHKRQLFYYRQENTIIKNDAATHLKTMTGEKDAEIVRLNSVIAALTPSGEIKSPLPMLEYVADKDGTQRENFRVSAISSAGKQFFGYNAEMLTAEFKTISLEELRSRLATYIAPPQSYLHDLSKDQQRVMKDLYENQTPVARYPIIFNDFHSEPAFRNKCFIPIIVEARKTRAVDGKEKEFVKVIYLDTDILPQYVLRREIWETLKANKQIDFSLMPDELRKLQKYLQTRRDSEDVVDSLQAVSDALDDLLIRNGSFEFIECCAKVGFFALREYAKNLDLKQLKKLIEKLLGPDPALEKGSWEPRIVRLEKAS